MAEIESERVAKLSAYLTESGMDSYELSVEEQNALQNSKNNNWCLYRIGDLFNKVESKFNKKTFDKEKDTSEVKTSEFSLPLVNAKNGDNGIMYYGRPEDFENIEMTLDIIEDGAVSTGSCYPQPQKTGVLYNAYLIKTNVNITKEQLLFFASVIHKSIKPKFGYELKAIWNRVKQEMILLPIKNGEIDFEYMENYISAIKKLVIKDIVLYVNRKNKGN